jgi:hypothetical protein
MAKNREMLKEAIAEAKAVKEAAIANAKAALEEAFTPQLKSMLSMKLQEMEEETNEAMYEEGDTKEVDEALGTLNDPDTETVHGNVAEEKEEDMMEVDLEELLAELELEEGEEVEESLNEAEEEEAEEEEEEEGEEEEEEGDTEMEDLSDDELKEMIEDVIAQMIKDGELEAGPEFEGEEEGEEMEMDAEEEEEVDLAELLKEIEEMEKDEMKEEKESVDEIFGLFKTNNLMNYLTGEKGVDKSTAKKVVSALEKNPNDDSARAELKKVMSADDINDFKNYISNPKRGPKNPLTAAPLKDAGNMVAAALTGKEFVPVKLAGGGDSPTSRALGETEEMKAELEEAYKTIDSLRSELNEINLLNAKLLYTNKIFKSKNLNENQKVKVLSSFDKAKNVGEVKMVFETLSEGIKVKKDTIKENLGRASKATTIPTTKKPIVESNDVFERMQKLAGIIK